MDRFPQELREAGVRFARSDRYAAGDLRELLYPGTDAVIDCVGYTAAHAGMLLPFRQGIGSLVFISSKAVYIDGQGRHSNSGEPPDFGGPVTEKQPTMAPSDIDYNSREGYGANKGRGANHPTAAVNLAALVAFCAARPASCVLNSADPDAPDGLTISRIIAAHLAHAWTEILLDETEPAELGDHPWNTLPPFILDTSAARRLGFVPAGSYAEMVKTEVDWLVQAARSGDPAGALASPDDPYFQPFFDYARENAWLDERSGATRP